MKRWLALIISVAMVLSVVGTLAESTPGAMDLALQYVPQGAEFSSTGEDAQKLELTFKDKDSNQYRVVLNKLPLYVIRVNMKSAKEAGASKAELDESTVRGILQNRFPTAVIEKLFLEKKGEDEIIFHAILSLDGFLYKVRMNAQHGNITHYVMRGAPAPEQFQPTLKSQAEAAALAVVFLNGGTVTDIQFGRFAQVYYYLVEVHKDDVRLKLMINAVDGTLFSQQAMSANLVEFRQSITTAAQVPVSKDDDWLFEDDVQDDGIWNEAVNEDPFSDSTVITQPVPPLGDFNQDDDDDNDGIADVNDDDDTDDDDDGTNDGLDGDDDNEIGRAHV